MALLRIQDLKMSYASPGGGSTAVLDVPRFEMAAGAQVCLAGQSGSGKTTLLNVIAGIQRPDRGVVDVAGTDITRLSESARDRFRAANIGYVFQTFNLLGAYSALENVLMGMLFGPGPDRAFARELLEELGLGDRLGYRPHQLSIGQQQRVALARALANRPQLVLADEPTGSLDPASSQEALGLVRRTCQGHGAALLIVSHDTGVIADFEQGFDLSEINRASRGVASEAAAQGGDAT
jgi:putative ABC transport system ATP-binding protein